MKTALFIIENNILVKSQIIKLCERLDDIGLTENDLIILQKRPRIIKLNSNQVVKEKTFIKKIFDKIKNNMNKDLLSKIYFKYHANPKIRKRFDKLKIQKYYIDSANNNSTKEILVKQNVEICIFVFYDEIIKEDIINLTRHSLNIHPAFLPDFRGCQPLFWQMFYKQRLSALTLHKMVKGIDEGDIIFELPYEIVNERSFYYNNIKMYNNLYLLILMGLRRLKYFDDDFGLPQRLYQRTTNYFPRPTKNNWENFNNDRTC